MDAKENNPQQYIMEDTLKNVTNYSDFPPDDDACFERAKESNTIEAYDDYLAKFPEGKHRQEVKELKKKLEFTSQTEDGGDPQPKANPWKGYEKSIEKKVFEKSQSDITDTEFVDVLEGWLKNGELTRRQLIDFIKKDNNLFNRGVIIDLVEKKILSTDDLLEAGIGEDFICAMVNLSEGDKEENEIKEAENPTSIDNASTEVYFWGIPSSGKSCVMAALMSVLKSGDLGIWEPQLCKGGEYMNQLSVLYKENEVSALLSGTPLMSTYEMAFNLTREENWGRRRKKTLVHPFTFIDLAGGILFLMYDYLLGKNMTKEHKDYLETIKNLISGTNDDSESSGTNNDSKSRKKRTRKKRTTNRKMHCFVIEYGAETWKYKGFDQLTYLEHALQYIEKTHIFENKSTDSIYVIVTKADRANLHGEKLDEEIREYVVNKYYKNFYNRLKGIAKTCEINDGEVSIVPFSIGEVKMRSLCRFNDTAAKVLMERLAERSIGNDESKWGKFQRRMRE